MNDELPPGVEPGGQATAGSGIMPKPATGTNAQAAAESGRTPKTSSQAAAEPRIVPETTARAETNGQAAAGSERAPKTDRQAAVESRAVRGMARAADSGEQAVGGSGVTPGAGAGLASGGRIAMGTEQEGVPGAGVGAGAARAGIAGRSRKGRAAGAGVAGAGVAAAEVAGTGVAGTGVAGAGVGVEVGAAGAGVRGRVAVGAAGLPGPGERGAGDRPLLLVRDLHVAFPSETGPVRAVRGVSWDVYPGEVLGIVGESGSGKSVSSLAVMGLLPDRAHVSGSIRLRDRELIGLNDREMSGIRGRRISIVFQDPMSALTPVYTVGAQVAEAVRAHDRKINKAAAAQRAVELLDLVGIPNPKAAANAFPHEFSGGMRQRVVIAIAVANDPDLIIADEPTTALDVTVQAQVLDVLSTAREVTGAGIMLITHDLGVVAGFADRLMVMYAGRTVETGSVDDVYARPRMPYTLGLLGAIPRLGESSGGRLLVPIPGRPPSVVDLPPGCPFAPRCPMVVDTCRTEEPPLLPIVGGHEAACIRAAELDTEESTVDLAGRIYGTEEPRPAESRQRGERILEVNGLVKHFPVTKGAVFRRTVGTVHAVDGVSFDIAEHETLGLVGESGCGKTTTLLQILELAKPQAGSITLFGQDVATAGKATRTRLRRDIQVVFQDPVASIDPRMPISDIIAEPLRLHGFTADRARARVAELLRLVGMSPEHAARYPAEFSGGQRQRVGIARALALEPRLVVLDEPVSALDVSVQAGVLNLLGALRDRLGLSYLFVSHDLSVIGQVADRVAVMYLGRIVEIGSTADVLDTPRHPYTRALLSAVPIPDPVAERRRERIVLVGDRPDPAHPPSGCRFRTRCFVFSALNEQQKRACLEIDPVLDEADDHQVACHYPS